MSESEGELKKQIDRLFDKDYDGEYLGMKFPDAISKILDEAKQDAPTIGFTIETLEHEIEILKTDPKDKRVLISWMQNALENVKWRKKWFGNP